MLAYKNEQMTYQEWENLHKALRNEKKIKFKTNIKRITTGVGLIVTAILEFAMGYAGLIDEGGLFIFTIPIGILILFDK